MTKSNFIDGDKLHTDDSAGETLGIKTPTLRKWRREGIGPPWIRLGGRLIGYLESDLKKWLVQNRYTSNADELSAKSKR